MADAVPYETVRLMGLSHTEFMRSLPAAAVGMHCRRQGTVIHISDSTRRVAIELGPEREYRLGSLALPQTQVSLTFEGFSVEKREEFLRRFDLAFQRGGG